MGRTPAISPNHSALWGLVPFPADWLVLFPLTHMDPPWGFAWEQAVDAWDSTERRFMAVFAGCCKLLEMCTPNKTDGAKLTAPQEASSRTTRKSVDQMPTIRCITNIKCRQGQHLQPKLLISLVWRKSWINSCPHPKFPIILYQGRGHNIYVTFVNDIDILKRGMTCNSCNLTKMSA